MRSRTLSGSTFVIRVSINNGLEDSKDIRKTLIADENTPHKTWLTKAPPLCCDAKYYLQEIRHILNIYISQEAVESGGWKLNQHLAHL
jgi:hypothetical protein